MNCEQTLRTRLNVKTCRERVCARVSVLSSTRHQIPSKLLAGTVRSDKAQNARRDLANDLIDAQNLLPVEFRHIFQT